MMVFVKELKKPKTVGELVAFLKDLSADMEILATIPGGFDLQIWRDEEIGVSRLDVREAEE